MEHHLSQHLVSTSSISEREISPVISVASHNGHTKSDTSKEARTESAIVLSASEKESKNANAIHDSNGKSNSFDNNIINKNNINSAETASTTPQTKSEVIEESGNTSPHTHVITEAPSSRADHLKVQMNHISSPSITNLSQQTIPTSLSPTASVVVPVQESSESLANASANSNGNILTIHEMSQAQIVIGGNNNDSMAWHQQANRARVNQYGAHRIQSSHSLEHDRESLHRLDSSNSEELIRMHSEPSSPRYYMQQQLHR